MPQKDQNTMPSGFAGLTRYFDDSPEKIKMKPEYIVFLAVTLVVIVQSMHIMVP